MSVNATEVMERYLEQMLPFNTIITKEGNCPECFKQHTNTDYRYVDIYHDDVIVAHVALGIMDGIIGKECLLHGVVEKWSKESFKAIKTGFYGVIVPELKKLGVSRIVVINAKEGSEKMVKFSKLFNFQEIANLTYLALEI